MKGEIMGFLFCFGWGVFGCFLVLIWVIFGCCWRLCVCVCSGFILIRVSLLLLANSSGVASEQLRGMWTVVNKVGQKQMRGKQEMSCIILSTDVKGFVWGGESLFCQPSEIHKWSIVIPIVCLLIAIEKTVQPVNKLFLLTSSLVLKKTA